MVQMKPMTETCETTDFFEPDTVYIPRDRKSHAREFTPEFKCEAVFSHPDTHVLYAVGFSRNGHWQRWFLTPSVWLLTDWARGWEKTPDGEFLPQVRD
jgi:hypothetical protein